MNIYDIFRPKVKTEFQEISFFADSTNKQVKTILTVDATLELEQSTEMTATDHPIEKGKLGFVSDHLDNKPLRLNIRGVIANEPLDIKGAMVGGFSGAVGTVSSRFATPFVGQLVQTKLGGELTERTGGKSRAKTAMETLMALQKNKQVFSIVSKLRIYNNMGLEGLTINPNEGDDIEFSGSMREIAVVETAYVTIKQVSKANGVVKKVSIGKKETEKISDEARKQTTARMAVRIITGG